MAEDAETNQSTNQSINLKQNTVGSDPRWTNENTVCIVTLGELQILLEQKQKPQHVCSPTNWAEWASRITTLFPKKTVRYRCYMQ